ncbi:MAG: aminoacyl-tRNA hydrolase [Chlamydia sp.]
MGSHIVCTDSIDRVVVGLGNPGALYKWTRHNIGAEVVSSIASTLHVSLKKNRLCLAEIGEAEIEGKRTLFVVPQTYMNLSGDSVAFILKSTRIASENLLVVIDDLETRFGSHTVAFNGGARGHNGIRSIHSKIQTKSFFQLRCGIGRPDSGDIAEYVLQKFSREEIEGLSQSVMPKVEETVYAWIANSR